MSDLPLDDGSDNSDGGRTGAYQVLARKYRPQNFDDLIGHEAMVRTLRNAFVSNRIAHAYILTGVRGVGKTTTARILARALNYVSADGTDNGPQIDMPEAGLHCEAIAQSRHPDVLEMDAASRTGVNDVRELIEGVRYAPVEARYKVYIIDEVHMLSTQAFNALLKTLEEPPAHVKFIFATTEIRKLPVTVLSRCQRFDLRRIAPETLTNHLSAIAEKEGAAIDPDALTMIARAGEGSVRDALSILDQAIVQHDSDAPVSGGDVRQMLGLADRSRIWDLFDALLKGDIKKALEEFRDQYDTGAEPVVVLRDLLEITHLVTRVKAAGADAAAHGAAGEADAARAGEAAEHLAMGAMTRAWTLLMKGLSETQNAPDPVAAGEMALIRIGYASQLPTPDDALRILAREETATAPSGGAISGQGPQGGPAAAYSGGGSAAAAQPAFVQSAPVPDLVPSARLRQFEDIARLAGAKRDVRLRAELEGYVRVVRFEQGRIELRLDARAPSDLPGRLTKSLKDWTGDQWVVTVNTTDEGSATLRDARAAEVMAHPFVQKAMSVFPKAKITAIRDAALDEFSAAPEEDDNDGEPR